MISNNKISALVSSQVPFFVRNDHENFVAFLEAYYEWLEQSNNTVNIAKTMAGQLDVDSADIFIDSFYKNFLPLIPDDVIVDRTLLLKHVKDFYRARGSENSLRFLLRILFNEEAEFYYPQRDILKASDGKWFVEKSIKIDNIIVEGVANTQPDIAEKFVGRKITGTESNATALVERIDTYFDRGALVRELKISEQFRDFVSGEEIEATFIEDGETKEIRAGLFSGSINTIQITNRGSGYQAGDTIRVEGNSTIPAVIIVASVSTGNLTSIAVVDGGSGFQNLFPILITGGGGTGANGAIESVSADGVVHPNSYNVVWNTIQLEANTVLSNAVYSNLNSSNVNTTIANAMSYFTYANTGPISTVILYNTGVNYSTKPTVTAEANTRVRNLGVLGKMIVINGGEGYDIDDVIEFDNVFGGYGSGARGRVKNVNSSLANTITEVEFVEVPGHIVGGSGYEQSALPIAKVLSSNVLAKNANIIVTSVLGTGERLTSIGASAGAIQTLSVISRGSGYEEAPTLNLRSSGDGTAQAVATIITGVYTYPGRYLNDDGHLSSYNFIQDRDYYQKFSYVIKIKQSLEKYRAALKNLVHPAGMKVFGEYMYIENDISVPLRGSTEQYLTIYEGKTYTFIEDFVFIELANHNLSVGSIVTLDWKTGTLSTANTRKGEYVVSNIDDVNTFVVDVSANASPYSTGTVDVGKIIF
jgi:hypothetical protein